MPKGLCGFQKGHKMGLGKKTGRVPQSAFKKGHIPWLKGKHHTIESKLKMRDSKLGKYVEEKSPHWKGDAVGYEGIHTWIHKFGSPMKCGHCRKICKNNYQIHWANISGKYKRKRDDWFRLCVSCHSIYDHCRKK